MVSAGIALAPCSDSSLLLATPGQRWPGVMGSLCNAVLWRLSGLLTNLNRRSEDNVLTGNRLFFYVPASGVGAGLSLQRASSSLAGCLPLKRTLT